ncbi:hypothetical protein F5146DRAFT_1145939 [Armillaria mellea]|nr:hypothetical protein F5146DRAFT_1145939 [Armillaria mellea]
MQLRSLRRIANKVSSSKHRFTSWCGESGLLAFAPPTMAAPQPERRPDLAERETALTVLSAYLIHRRPSCSTPPKVSLLVSPFSHYASVANVPDSPGLQP